MTIKSTRFGEVEVADDAILDFPDGLIGLPGTKYALLEDAEGSPFAWLHSVEDAGVALPVTTPWLFCSDYEVRVPDEDAKRLELERPEDAHILCVVRVTQSLSDSTINLAGPLIVHKAKRRGRQIINDAHGYSVRHPLFTEEELQGVHESPASPQAAAV